MSRLLIGTWLTAMWVLLWGEVTAANVIAGVAAAAVLLVVFPAGEHPGPRHRPRPIAALWFLLFFLAKLVEANAVLAWEVVTPRNRIREGIVAVPVRGCSPVVVTIIANTISLTPGTLTLEVDPDREELYVHVLHLRDLELVRTGLLRFRDLAVRAFGSPEARAAVEVNRR